MSTETGEMLGRITMDGALASGVVRNMRVEEAMAMLGARAKEPLSAYTTLRVGGPAEWFLHAESVDDIAVARIVARSRGLPTFLIGNGSNLLVSDAGFRGLVIKLDGGLATITDMGMGTVKVGAGVKLPELARYYRDANAGGMEWAFGVPGSVGGALFMNAGTSDGEMKDVVESVIVEGRGGALMEVPRDACSFGYRQSRFHHTGEVIVGAIVRLNGQGYRAAVAKRSLDQRKKTQPLTMPNCGSVFANPPGDHAGRMIEAAGLKGRTIGAAQISTVHANFIVNLGGARAADIKSLMDLARAEVKAKFGIELKSEIRLIGEFS